ncbi:hypothetical protein AB0I81_35975 [Nonomuraea sp. NPDC050404]|uniref:hypothetical protein n=1 Tax=Nonomuraea sp. NPDC050404 TaxID=3155783 RepID=UPI0033FDB3A2
MARTLPPVQAIPAEIDALFTEGRDLVEVIEDVARFGARLIIQTAVEAEVDAFLGRARYQRAAASDGEETTPGAGATLPRWSWTTCSWTPRTQGNYFLTWREQKCCPDS